jgi:hypothetical protein
MKRIYSITYGETLEDVDLLVASPWEGSWNYLSVWLLSPMLMIVDDGCYKRNALKKLGFHEL